VHDNGSSMVAAACLSGLTDLGCYIHTMQLVVNAALRPTVQRAVGDIIATGRSIVGHFRHSSKATERLQQIQASLNTEASPYPQHRLIQDVQTRWNSTFYMLQRLREQKRAIGLYSQEHDISVLMPHQWNLIDKLLITLTPFEQETKKASLATSTAGIIIPGVRMLSAFLKKPAHPGDDFGIITMRQVMLQDLTHRYADIEKSKLCVLATTLDPTAKLCFFTEETKEIAKEWLLEATMYEYKNRRETRDPRQSSASTSTTASTSATHAAGAPDQNVGLDRTQESQATDTVLYDYWQQIVQSQDQASNPSYPTSEVDKFQCLQEVNMYLAEALKPLALPPALPEDPILYWKACSHVYPNLSAVARRYLGAPPSSVDSERAFSAAGNICTDKRSLLSASKMEMLLFLEKNLPIINFHY